MQISFSFSLSLFYIILNISSISVWPQQTPFSIFQSQPLCSYVFFSLFLPWKNAYSLSQDATFWHDERPPQWMRPLSVCSEKRCVLSRSTQSGCIVLKPSMPSASQVGQSWKPCAEQDVEACLALWPPYIYSLYPMELLIQLSHISIWQ